jgi:hypothetical protein
MTAEEFEAKTDLALRFIEDHLKEYVEGAPDRGDLLIVARIEDEELRVEPCPLGDTIRGNCGVAAMHAGIEERFGRLLKFSAEGLVPILFIREQGEGGTFVQVAKVFYVPEGLSKGGKA